MSPESSEQLMGFNCPYFPSITPLWKIFYFIIPKASVWLQSWTVTDSWWFDFPRDLLGCQTKVVLGWIQSLAPGQGVGGGGKEDRLPFHEDLEEGPVH